MAQDSKAYCEVHDMDFFPCKHITTCIHCSLEKRRRKEKKFHKLEENDLPIYYCECFYCVLEGKRNLDCEWDSYGEIVRQVMDGFHIGYRDGKYRKPKIDGTECPIRELAMLYNEGYKAGKYVRELKNLT